MIWSFPFVGRSSVGEGNPGPNVAGAMRLEDSSHPQQHEQHTLGYQLVCYEPVSFEITPRGS